ncbi:hypothetical protein P8452_02542 [Trifolium repens]|nr:hypothetical protein P8452_02542 [Trifolium repens]
MSRVLEEVSLFGEDVNYDRAKEVKEFDETKAGVKGLLDSANWRDTLMFDFQDGPLDPQAYPLVCREAVSKYMEHILKLKELLSELMSEALGLKKDYLKSDFMQLISNDKFKSVEHRVLAGSVGPRASVACHLSKGLDGYKALPYFRL